jgi:hypothetical protein
MPKLNHLKTKKTKPKTGTPNTADAKATADIKTAAVGLDLLSNIAAVALPTPTSQEDPLNPHNLDLQQVEWAMPFKMAALPTNRQLNPKDTAACQAMVQHFHAKRMGGDFLSPEKPPEVPASQDPVDTILQRGLAAQAAKSLLPKVPQGPRKRKLSVNKENMAPNPRPAKTRAQKQVAAKAASKAQKKEKGKAQLAKPKLAWPEILKLMVERNLFATKPNNPAELCMFGRPVMHALEEATGYSHTQLRSMRILFSQGQIPSQEIGRPRRIPLYLVNELRTMLGKGCKLDEHFTILINKVSVYLNMSLADQEANSVEWKPICAATMHKIHKQIGDSTRAAEIQSLARALAGNDFNVFMSLCASIDVLRPTCGIKPLTESKAEEGIEPERKLNPNWIWNFDASAGKTLNAEPLVRSLRNAAGVKLVLNPGETETMTQQFNLIQAVNGAGKMMSPLIGIRADTDHVLKGSPLIITLGQEELSILNPFYKADVAPPLLVVYARGDKACLTSIFLEKIVTPVLDSEFDELVRKDGRHIITCDGVGENLKLVADLQALDWWNERRRELVKLAANATHKTQVCDLLKLFHWIKVPEKFLKQITASRQRETDQEDDRPNEVGSARAHGGEMEAVHRSSVLGVLRRLYQDERRSHLQSLRTSWHAGLRPAASIGSVRNNAN